MRGLSVGAVMLSVMACGPAVAASCNSAFGMASVADMDAFKADPLSILKTNPTGGGALARSARALVLADTEFADVMLSLGVAANADQRSAMGSGLGQAALACSRTQPEVVQRMQTALLSRGSPEMSQAFKAVAGDIPTLAVSAPAVASSPIGGTDASLVGGGENQVSQGVSQRSSGTTQGFGTATVARAAATTRVATVFLSGGGTTPSTPVPTVPGPAIGMGLPALLFMLVSGFFYRRRIQSVPA